MTINTLVIEAHARRMGDQLFCESGISQLIALTRPGTSTTPSKLIEPQSLSSTASVVGTIRKW